MTFGSCSFQCGYMPDGSTMTMSLLASTGDLFQYYKGSHSNPDSVTPDWSNGLTGTQIPLIRMVLMESDPNIEDEEIAGCVVDNLTEWYIDGDKILFDDAGVSINGKDPDTVDNVAGLFRKVATGGRADAPFGGLEILGNLVKALNGQSANITCIAFLNVDGVGTRLQANTTIRMIKATGESSFASIYCDNGQTFVLDEKSRQSVECKVSCFRDGTQLAANSFYRIWYLLVDGAWTEKARTDTFTVNRDDIATFGEVKVECYEDAARTKAKMIASDIQTIQDSSDSYILTPNPTPADAKFYQTGGPEKITFAPKLSQSDGSAGPACKFIFSVFDHAGVTQPGTPTPKQDTYDLQKSVAVNINEGPVVVITAVEA